MISNDNYHTFCYTPNEEYTIIYRNATKVGYYFNFENKITKFLQINDFSKTNVDYYINNHYGFYYLNGFNPDIMTSFFKYNRRMDIEEYYFNIILKQHNILPNEKYIVICEYAKDNCILDRKYFNNSISKIINICYLVDIPLYLIKLLENSEEIHMFPNSNLLMIQYLFHSNNFNYKNKIFVHFYARPSRGQIIDDMYRNPGIPNNVYLE